MEAFVRSAELGGFSAAARDLRISPSAVSKLVSRLERSLGARLLHRTTRRLRPTPEGEMFLARCRRVLAELEDAENEVGHAMSRPRGVLRMHVGVGVAMHLLVPALPGFMARYPAIDVDLSIEDRVVDMVKEGLDISVRPGPPLDQSLVAQTVFAFQRIVCASPAYLARAGMPASPAELARHRCIRVSSFPGRSHWAFVEAGERRLVEIANPTRVNNADAVLQLALAGAGIARLNEFIVAKALREGRLVPVLREFHCPDEEPMLALHPHMRHRVPRVAAMLAFLKEHFGARPWRRDPFALSPTRTRSTRSRRSR